MLLLSVNTTEDSGRGRRYSASTSIRQHPAAPAKKGYKRFHLAIGGFMLQHIDERSVRLVQISDLGDLVGTLSSKLPESRSQHGSPVLSLISQRAGSCFVQHCASHLPIQTGHRATSSGRAIRFSSLAFCRRSRMQLLCLRRLCPIHRSLRKKCIFHLTRRRAVLYQTAPPARPLHSKPFIL